MGNTNGDNMKIIFAYILSRAFVVSLYEYIGVVMYLFFLILVISFVTAMMAYYKGRIIGFIMVWFQIPLILGKILVIWRLPLIMRNWLDFSRHINDIILFGFPGSCVTKKKKKKKWNWCIWVGFLPGGAYYSLLAYIQIF